MYINSVKLKYVKIKLNTYLIYNKTHHPDNTVLSTPLDIYSSMSHTNWYNFHYWSKGSSGTHQCLKEKKYHLIHCTFHNIRYHKIKILRENNRIREKLLFFVLHEMTSHQPCILADKATGYYLQVTYPLHSLCQSIHLYTYRCILHWC